MYVPMPGGRWLDDDPNQDWDGSYGPDRATATVASDEFGRYTEATRDYAAEAEYRQLSASRRLPDAGDSNLYTYANNAPTDEIDPSGLQGVPTLSLEKKRTAAGVEGAWGVDFLFQLSGPADEMDGGQVLYRFEDQLAFVLKDGKGVPGFKMGELYGHNANMWYAEPVAPGKNIRTYQLQWLDNYITPNQEEDSVKVQKSVNIDFGSTEKLPGTSGILEIFLNVYYADGLRDIRDEDGWQPSQKFTIPYYNLGKNASTSANPNLAWQPPKKWRVSAFDRTIEIDVKWVSGPNSRTQVTTTVALPPAKEAK